MSKVKPRGPMSGDDKDFIRKNIHELGLEEVAKQINRTQDAVQSFLNAEGIYVEDSGVDIETIEHSIATQFKGSPEFESLRLEFDEDELKYFVYKYSKFYAQFKGDVLATEQTQIIQLCKFEILMRRNLRDAKTSKAGILRLEEQLVKIYNQYMDTDMPDAQKALVLNIENQLLSARSAQQSKSGEFVKLQEKHSSLMKELKGTRDQRITKAETYTKDIMGLIKSMQTTKFRAAEGRQQALVNLAVDKEKAKLSEYHEYLNKEVDRPILSADTIGEEDGSN